MNKDVILGLIMSVVVVVLVIVCNREDNKIARKHHTVTIDTITKEDTYIESRDEHKLDADDASRIIKDFEGFVDSVYTCPAGVPTIGYGTTKCCLNELYRLGYIKDKNFYKWGQRITKAKADILVNKTVQMIYDIVCKNIPDTKYLSPRAQAALVSWTYQSGIGSVSKKTGIIGNFPELTDHIDDKMLYDILCERAYYGKYKNRRLKEASLIIGTY